MNLLILGASSDLALALIPAIAENYENIIAHYFSSPDRLNELNETVQSSIIPIQADFSDEESTASFFARVESLGLPIDHILHCPSAHFTWKNYPKLTWADFESLYHTQVRSLFYAAKSFLPQMAKRKSGKIVSILSAVTVNIPPSFAADYVSSKYALLGLVNSLAAEYAPKHVQINAVSPTTMDTKFNSHLPGLMIEKAAAENPAGRNATVSDVIPAIQFLLSDRSDFITGQNICISGGGVI